jgi:SAM-dependent methyltransferase
MENKDIDIDKDNVKKKEKENFTDVNKWDNYYINAEKNQTNPPWESQEVFHVLKDFFEDSNKYLNHKLHIEKNFLEKNENKMKIIELGSGSSYSSLWLASKGHDVTAVDISPYAIKRAKNIDIKNTVNWVCMDIFDKNMFKENNNDNINQFNNDNLDNIISEESFDFIFDMQCFHVLKEINCDLFCDIVFKLLKKGGKIMIVVGANIDSYAKDKIMEKSENIKGPPKLFVDDFLIPFNKIGLKVISIKLSRFNSTIAYGNEPPLCWVGIFEK